ncbi:NAD(P) transhydrogenase alpha subunit (EC 1.6.1.2), partial [Pseudomonas sp. FEN]
GRAYLPRYLQPDHLRAGDICRLPRGLERYTRTAHAIDGGHQRDLGDRDRRRHAGRRPDRDPAGQDHGHPGGGPGSGERVRWLPGYPQDARDVQEKSPESGKRRGVQV